MKCRCTKTKKRLVTYRHESDLPPDLLHSVEHCPECSAFWARMKHVSALLALKRYEQPGELVLERCCAEVRRRVAAMQAEGAAHESFWDASLPAFRYGMAALFIALLGLHMLSASHLPPLHTTERSLAEYTRGVTSQTQQLAQDERPNPEFSVMMLSNWAPRVQQNSLYQFIGLGQ